MKIKTITCHDVYNCGASLQAYALMKYLQKLGHDVEIIDYKPNYLSGHFKLCAINNPRYKKNVIVMLVYILLKMPERLLSLKRKWAFDDFKHTYLYITKQRYSSNEELKDNLPDADVYFAGSDQIWNTLFENGKDPAFYLDFVPNDKIKATYAASFATEDISCKFKEEISKRLQRLDAISVRESSGLDILRTCGIEKGIQVLDPVFLLGKYEWDKMYVESTDTDDYLFVYDFDQSLLIEQIAKQIASVNKLKIYTVFKSEYADKHIKNIRPQEFVSYIKNAKFILSNSFHATAFSIIFEKQFLVVNRKENINTRMRDLLLELDIEKRLISNIYKLEEGLTPINYEIVKQKMDILIQKSKKYINEVLGGVTND